MHLYRPLTAAFLAVLILTACAPAAPAPTQTPTQSPPTLTPPPAATFTPSPVPLPTATLPYTADIREAAVTLDDLSQIDPIAREPFPLRRDLGTGEAIFHCLLGETHYEIIPLTEKIEITGTVNCHYRGGVVRLPLGIYDRETNRLVYWMLSPVENPDFVDFLAFRAETRWKEMIAVMDPDSPAARTPHDQTNRLANAYVVVMLGQPEELYRGAFNSQNFEAYIRLFYADPARSAGLRTFIDTGDAPADNLLFPLDLAFVKRPE